MLEMPKNMIASKGDHLESLDPNEALLWIDGVNEDTCINVEISASKACKVQIDNTLQLPSMFDYREVEKGRYIHCGLDIEEGNALQILSFGQRM